MKGFILLEFDGIADIYRNKKDIYLEGLDALSGEFRLYDFDGYRYEFHVKEKTRKVFFNLFQVSYDHVYMYKTKINEKEYLRKIIIENLIYHLNENYKLKYKKKDLEELSYSDLIKFLVKNYGYAENRKMRD